MIYAAHRKHRRGTVLILFALLVFALLALAGMVVDVGITRVAQRQMRTAVDAAALEGLRFRDSPGPDPTVGGSFDNQRREAAAVMVPQIFSGLNSSPAAIGSGYGGQLQQLWVYGTQPLELNSSNMTHGDMVPGTFGLNTQSFDQTNPRDEDSEYNRRDFVPSSPTTAATAPSFLVRMRRTNNFGGLDDVSGVSSFGETLPFIFGAGALINKNAQGYDPRTNGMAVRATAIADARRAKTIGPAYPPSLYTLVPQTPAFPGIAGAAPFALNLLAWNGLTAGQPTQVTVNADGSLSAGGSSIGQLISVTGLANQIAAGDNALTVSSAQGFPIPGAAGFADGVAGNPFKIRIDSEIVQVTAVAGTPPTAWTVLRGQDGTQAEQHSANAVVTLQMGIVMGETASSLASPITVNQPPSDLLSDGVTSAASFVPIVDDTAGTAAGGLILGFGQVNWVVTSWSASGTNCLLTLTPASPATTAGTVVSANATAAFALPLPLNLVPAQLQTLLTDAGNLSRPVLAPALARLLQNQFAE
jgi:hypothetical protein